MVVADGVVPVGVLTRSDLLDYSRPSPLMEFETRAIHAGQEPEQVTGAVNVPIFQTSTYVQDGVGQMRAGTTTPAPSTRRGRRCRSASRRSRAARTAVAFASGHGGHLGRARDVRRRARARSR